MEEFIVLASYLNSFLITYTFFEMDILFLARTLLISIIPTKFEIVLRMTDYVVVRKVRGPTLADATYPD